MEAGTTETRTPVEAGATPETRAPLDAEADVETPSEPGATAELETMPEPGDTAEAGGAAETGRTETSPSPETPGPAPTGPTGAAAGAAAQARSDAVSDWNVALGLKPDQTVLRYVVQPGDSLWSLAQRHLGAGSAWPRLVAANADLIRSAGHIEVGWELVIPLDSTDPDEAWEHVVVAGDSLWSIAAQRLGSGQRWPELVQANLDRISDPNQIEIGWRLRLPDPTPAVSADETPDGTGTEAGDGPGAGEPTDSTAPAPADGPGEDGSEPGQRSGGDDGQTDQTTDSQPPAADTTPSAEADATTSPPTAEPSGPPDLGQTGDAEEDRSKLHDLVEGTATSLGVFLAGGVTLVLRRRREDQLRARPVGQRLPHPGPEATRLETALGQVAATDGLPGDADILDSLDRSEAGQGRLIFISERGVEVTDRWGEEVDAWGDSPSGDLQPGAMVGLGRDERGRLVLIDLEQPGSVTIRGTDPTQRAGVIRALALDLACQRWTDGVEVIVVGDEQASLFDGFEAVEVLADPTLALARLVRVVAERRRHADQGDLAECRRDPDRADAWHPLVCFFTQPLEAASLAELTQLTSGPSLGVTAVIGQDPPLTPELTGRLILTLEPSGHALLEPAGLSVRPPNLNESDGLDDLMATTAQTDTEPAWWTGSDQPEPAGPAGQAGIPPALAEVAPIPPTELGSADGVVFDPTDLASAAAGRVGVPDGAVALTDDEIDPTGRVGETPDPIADATAEAFAGGTAATAVTSAVAPTSPIFVPEPTPEARISPVTEFSTPSLLMLGPIELHGAAGARPNRAERSCLEYCGWLLEHPGSTAQAMTQGLLVAEGTRRSNLSRLRAWLGASPEGQPYLPDAYSGRLALDPAVTSDWSRLQLLIAGGVDRTPTERLRAALELVRGAPLADAAPGQWHWAEELRTDMVSVIRDIGLALADRALASDDLDAARWSIARALAAAQGDELLLVARLRTEHRAGNRREVERLVGWITRQARQLGVDLFPETVALIQQIIEGTPRRPA